MTPDQEIHRANRAREVLENEVYIEAIDALKTEIRTQWETSPARDTQGRETLWLMLGLVSKIQLSLESTMENGKVAMAKLRHEQTLIDKARAWLG